MNEKVRRHVQDYLERNGKVVDEDDVVDAIQEAEQISRKELEEHRWYIEYKYVVKLDSMFIEFIDAEMKGEDCSLADAGIEFDSSTIREVFPVERTITAYEPKETII